MPARVLLIEECPYEPSVSSEAADTVIWLGAGFSRCATNARAPLMSGFFAGIKRERYSHLCTYLEARCSPIHQANVEAVLLEIEQMDDCPLPPRLRHSIMVGQNPATIREELEQFCIERLRFGEIDAEHWAVKLLAHANERTTIITTNYDTVAEQILSARIAARHCGPRATCHHCNMRAILQEDCNCDANSPPPVIGGRNAPLLKLHGSIAWHVCCNKACSIVDCLIASCKCTPTKSASCECCGDSCKPVIVLPSMRKTFSRYPQLGRMWERAHGALKQAKTLTVFGFSFPTSDCLICQVVRDALKQAQQLSDIIVIDVNPESVAQRIVELMPPNSDSLVITCPVPPDGTVPRWWAPAVAVEASA